MELLKLLNSSEIVAQIISFLLLLSILRIFVWKKMLQLLDARKEKIASGLKRIEDTSLEVSKLKSAYELKLTLIEEEARAKIHRALEEGKKIREEVRKKAHEEAQDIIEDARTNIKYELSKAKEELKEQIVDLTINGMENLIGASSHEIDARFEGAF